MCRIERQTSERSCWLPSDQKVLSRLQQFKRVAALREPLSCYYLSLTKKHKVMLAGTELLTHFSALLLNIEVASFFSIKVTYVIYRKIHFNKKQLIISLQKYVLITETTFSSPMSTHLEGGGGRGGHCSPDIIS